MNQTKNILLLILTLSIPFALSQTRKAIPAGRFEALSGIKISSMTRTENQSKVKSEELNLFWAEVVKNLPGTADQYYFYKSGQIEMLPLTSLTSKIFLESKQMNSRLHIFLTDSFERDVSTIRKLDKNKIIIVIKDKKDIKTVTSGLSNFEVLNFKADSKSNYYLLRTKNVQ